MNTSQTFTFHRRVEFADTDLAGMVHFSNILRYMEETEYAFLRSQGLCVVMDDERGKFGFPRLSVHCDYLRPARFEDELTIHLKVKSNDGKKIGYLFEIVKHDFSLAKGEFSVACCRFPIDKDPYPILIPDKVLEKIPLS